MHHTIALLGAGKIGEAIAALFSLSGRYTVKVCDANLEQATKVASKWPSCTAHVLNLNNPSELRSVFSGCSTVLSALPFSCNITVAQMAADCDLNYVDLTEDVRTTQAISHLAASARSWFAPQCGIAPGFISIAGAHLCSLFDSVESLRLRVGALPLYPMNRLKYNLTWSTEGLINEYCNPCESLQDGKTTLVPPLDGYERFTLDGVEYEAFNTSGGLGTLCTTMAGKINNLNYKSIRYPGHRDLMAFLLQDLKFANDQDTLCSIFERSLPTTTQDECLVLVQAVGMQGTRRLQKTYVSRVYHKTIGDTHFGAIQLTTAAGVCGVIDMILNSDRKDKSGLIKVEDLDLKEFLANEFGKHYYDEQALAGLS
jgi:saccharopine dehydrogenase-like NADP-dependent oxidoreductase